MSEKQFLIRESSLQLVLNTLADMPYKQVFQAINAIQSVTEVPGDGNTGDNPTIPDNRGGVERGVS